MSPSYCQVLALMSIQLMFRMGVSLTVSKSPTTMAESGLMIGMVAEEGTMEVFTLAQKIAFQRSASSKEDGETAQESMLKS